ncbi:MAG: hypothetical protein ACUVSV_10235 [Armatimonadota bacterium]
MCELRPSDLTIATVKTNYPSVKLTLVGKEVGFWEAEATEGTLQLPADEYTVSAYSVPIKDAQGTLWGLEVHTREEMKLKLSGSTETFLHLPGSLVVSLGVGSRVKQDSWIYR